MKKELFIEIINKLEELHKKREKVCEDIYSLFIEDGNPIVKIPLLEEAIDLLLFAIDEEDSISWYMYENNFGKRGLKAGYKGKEKPITTPADLYDFIYTEKTA